MESVCVQSVLKNFNSTFWYLFLQEPPKSKKVQHSNAKNAVLFEAIYLIIHMESDNKLLVRACKQIGQFIKNKEKNLRWV